MEASRARIQRENGDLLAGISPLFDTDGPKSIFDDDDATTPHSTVADGQETLYMQIEEPPNKDQAAAAVTRRNLSALASTHGTVNLSACKTRATELRRMASALVIQEVAEESERFEQCNAA